MHYRFNKCMDAWHNTGWRRPIGCRIFIHHFPQKSPIISGSFAENNLRLKVSYYLHPDSFSAANPSALVVEGVCIHTPLKYVLKHPTTKKKPKNKLKEAGRSYTWKTLSHGSRDWLGWQVCRCRPSPCVAPPAYTSLLSLCVYILIYNVCFAPVLLFIPLTLCHN